MAIDHTYQNGNGKESTNKLIAFRAFEPNLQLTNAEVHAILRRGALDAWAYPPDLLVELKKSYSNCEFDNKTAPTRVIFHGETGRAFYTDYEDYLSKNRTPPTVG